MLVLDAPVVGTENPRFQIGKDEMDHRQMPFCLGGIASEHEWGVRISQRGKRVVTLPAIGSHGSAGSNAVANEGSQIVGGTAGYNAEPQPPGIDQLLERHAALMLLPVLRCSLFGIFPQPHLDRTNDGGFVMHAATFAARPAADEALVHLDRVFSADPVALGSDHPRPQLMKDLKCGFVAGKAKLALELKRRLSRRLSGGKVGRPEPGRERRVSGLHDGAAGQRGAGFAIAAAEDYRGAGRKSVGLIPMAALGAGKAIGPAHGLKVFFASVVIREYLLEFRETGWESAWVHRMKSRLNFRVCQPTG